MPEEPKTDVSAERVFKNRMRSILKGVLFHVPENVPMRWNDEVQKIVSTLEKTGARSSWPAEYARTEVITGSSSNESQEVVRNVHLVKADQDGKAVMSPDSIQLPKTPSQFIAAEKDFIDGVAWQDIVKKISEERGDMSQEEFSSSIAYIKKSTQQLSERSQKLKDMEDVTKIVNALYSQGGLAVWPDKSLEGRKMYLVRKGEDGTPELSAEQITLPRRPAGFINALEAYIDGKPWSDVVALLPTSGSAGPDAKAIEELQNESSEVADLYAAGKMAEKIHAALSNKNSQLQALRTLHRRIEQLIDDKTKNVADLEGLKPLQAELESFARTEGGKYFMTPMFFDFLDNAALHIGKTMIAAALTEEQLAAALKKIEGYDFRYADAYAQPFAQNREDALKKIELLEELGRKRSEAGLDELTRKVDQTEFQSADMAQSYRDQLHSFIERKREIYWPKTPRKFMPTE